MALPGLGARWGEKKQPPEKAGGKGAGWRGRGLGESKG